MAGTAPLTLPLPRRGEESARSAPLPAWEREGPGAQPREGEGASHQAPMLNRILHVPKYSAYFFLISSTAFSCATGSAVRILICASFTRSAGSCTSG